MAEPQGLTVLRHVRRLVAAEEASRLSDRQLLEQFLAQQDESAFAALVQRHGPGVLSLCRSFLRHLQDAEDVFQATFLVLARKAASIRKREALGSWLYGVAYRLASKAKARLARRGTQEVAAVAEPEARTVDDMTWRELRQVMHEELNRLPEKYRTPLLLCYWEGRTQEEAAAQLGWRKGTLKERVQRARELLRGRLTRRGMALSAALATAMLGGRAATAAEALALVGPTTRAALAFAAGNKAAVGGLSAGAAALAEGVVQAMFLTKLKIATVALLALGVLGAGTAAVTHEAPAAGEAAQGGKARPDTRLDRDRLQGTWVLHAGERGGEQPPPGLIGGLKMVFTGNKIEIHFPDRPKGPATFALSPTKTPKEINLAHDGKQSLGIYRFNGDELTLCLDENQGPRPTEFKSPAGTAVLLLVLRREQAADDKAAKDQQPAGQGKAETDPAKLQLQIRKLQQQLEQARDELARSKAELEALRALAERARQEALVQRDQAERARRVAEQELQRAREVERAARLAAERAAAAERQAQVARRPQSANNLKQLALAMHNYHDANGKLPTAAIYGKDGKALLSWRVAILPYLEEQALYNEFKLDEPWDSAHNKKLLAKMPKVFAPVGAKAPANATFYRVFTGQGTVFEGDKGIRLQDILDGTSNTILTVEAGEAVPWTKPDELPYAPGKALPKLVGPFTEGFYIGLADGSVHFIRPPLNEDILRAAITRNGGEAIDLGKLGR